MCLTRNGEFSNFRCPETATAYYRRIWLCVAWLRLPKLGEIKLALGWFIETCHLPRMKAAWHSAMWRDSYTHETMRAA